MGRLIHAVVIVLPWAVSHKFYWQWGTWFFHVWWRGLWQGIAWRILSSVPQRRLAFTLHHGQGKPLEALLYGPKMQLPFFLVTLRWISLPGEIIKNFDVVDAVFLLGSLVNGAFIIPCNNELQKLLSLTDVTCHKTQLHTKNFVIIREVLCAKHAHSSL